MARILVIEDDVLSQRLMRDVLQVHGHDVVICGAAEAGLLEARANLPALILMDIRLPGIDGFEALARLRAGEDTRRIPVVAVTASVMLGERERIANAGFDAYHPKPVQIPELLEQIASLLRNSPKSAT